MGTNGKARMVGDVVGLFELLFLFILTLRKFIRISLTAALICIEI